MGRSQQRDLTKDLIFLGGLVVLAAALILYLVREGGTDKGPGVASGSQTAAATTQHGRAVERRQPNDPLALGDPQAPVTMVVFSDYRCPFCAKFSRETEPELVARYVDRGTLRIEWRDFPIFGDQSMLAARAGRAAAAQGRFWEFNRAVLAAAPERGHAEYDEDSLVGFARQAGVVDIDRFRSDLGGRTFDAAINADLVEGSSIGIASTPAFLVNGVPLLGAQPIDDFARVIDTAAGIR